MITNTIEKYVEELSTAVTNYGYNDEYGYYCDWKNGVEPIIRTTLTAVAEEARREALESTRKIVNRLELEIDVVVCECGEPYATSDTAILVHELAEHLDSLTNYSEKPNSSNQ
jgi:hypothetical protein